MERADIIVVGAGIVGLATALSLAERGYTVAVLEKELDVAVHQTGRNSGVVHTGVYYRPGSLKAELCVTGAARMLRFGEENGIPIAPVGKIIVAADDDGTDALRELMDRARTNGVPGLELLDAAGLGAREPHVTGVAGLLVPGAAAIDFGVVARVIARQLMDHGSTVRTAAPVVDIGADGSRIVAETTAGEWEGRFLINCAGLQSDRVARLAGAVLAVRIVPFRGEYQELVPERRHLVNGMVYPVPDPRFPFLGTHFTPTVDRRVEVGPNAVPALAREGYSWGAVRPDELWSSWGHRGALRLAGRHWWTGLGEVYRSISLRGFVRRLQRLVPEITGDDLVPAGTGVRAQAVDARGRLVDDFAIVPAARSLHVLNAPSPAATAAFAIGERLADDALAAMDVH